MARCRNPLVHGSANPVNPGRRVVRKVPNGRSAHGGFFPGPMYLAIPCHDPALPGILNSRLAKFYILSSACKKGMSGNLLHHLMKFPVRVPETEDGPDNKILTEISRLVVKRCDLAKFCSGSLSDNIHPGNELLAECDSEIDTLVYKLYGLTPGEIECIVNWLPCAEELPGAEEILK